jgi:hypothetical protein
LSREMTRSEIDRTTSVHHLRSYALPLVGAMEISSSACRLYDTKLLRIDSQAHLGK